jgi:hypothetical protein
MTKERMVIVAHCRNNEEATSLRALLDSGGIPVTIDGAFSVRVPEDQEESAIALIEATDVPDCD